MEEQRVILTAESVTEGHPDKLCDLTADRILDACLEKDADARVLVKCWERRVKCS